MATFQLRDRITAGVSFDIPGMGYRNPRTGLIEGFEADLARAIAERLFGAPDHIDFLQVTDEHRIPALQNDSVEMVLSQITITPDRAEQVDFSIPYLTTREAILVPRGSPIRGFEDLRGKRVAVTAGSISLRRMRASLPDATLVVTPLSIGGLEAVAEGRADAASNDLINLTMMQKGCGRPDQFELIDLGDRFDAKPFGVAVKKGRQSFVDLLNQAIASLAAAGEIDRLMTQNVTAVGNRSEFD